MDKRHTSCAKEIAVKEKFKADVIDAKVVRSMFEGSDHYAGLMKNEMNDR